MDLLENEYQLLFFLNKGRLCKKRIHTINFHVLWS